MDIQIFVGVDCDEQQMIVGFVGSQGILRSLSRTSSPLRDSPDRFGQRLAGMVRGLRGELNLRMRNFRAIGIGVPRTCSPETRQDIERQIKPLLEIPIYLDDREVLSEQGKAWMMLVEDMAMPRERPKDRDLTVVYGAAKLALDHTAK
ncbi:MAG: hypothetical protein COV75_07635 [Candidatus Omnitrophica bacterium CG11_big_fil_rev_8_21_14_0_20_63_9]|nr:MAG: hypothetical protein COV75_07635 [Candidatus Omnitrophica bacterium CG11_big_fil_rev_8_21_14_0_20_63_9]